MEQPGSAFRPGLVKRYGAQHALAGVDIDIYPGEAVATVGPSGSGKTTLLHALAGIIRPDAGEIHLAGTRIDQLAERKRSELRRREFGFVFQSNMLVAELTAEENVALPMLLGWSPTWPGHHHRAGMAGPAGAAWPGGQPSR